MISFEKLERRFGGLSFPGFLRFYALLHVLVFVLQMFKPDLFLSLMFDREKIFSGEVWRVVTCFFAASQFGGSSMMNIVFLFFAVNFAFMINDGLEAVWGVFKASLFYYVGIVCILAVQFLFPVQIPFLTFALYTSALLAFATVLPHVEILLFFILPIQIRWLGFLTGAGLLVSVLKSPILLVFFVPAFANYLLWAGIPALRRKGSEVKAARRRHKLNAGKVSAHEAFHTCSVCGRSDVSDPHLEFRVGADGREYCADHLEKQGGKFGVGGG